MEYSFQVKYLDLKEWIFNYYQHKQPNDQSEWSTLRPVGLLRFPLWVTTASVKFGESFSLTLSSPNQNLTFVGCARETTELSVAQLIYLRV